MDRGGGQTGVSWWREDKKGTSGLEKRRRKETVESVKVCLDTLAPLSVRRGFFSLPEEIVHLDSSFISSAVLPHLKEKLK